ncbi:MAG: class B sortase [Oscillospiraceae bacterium]|nr:class B sortase [Oscillospiraceae bacterium]
MARKVFSFLLTFVLMLSLVTAAAASTAVYPIVVPPESGAVVPADPAVPPPLFVVPPPPLWEIGSASFVNSTITTSAKHPYSTFKGWIAYTKQTNADATGWLHIPGTNINHPIVQKTRDENMTVLQDNDYYNVRNLHGQVFPNMHWRNFADTTIYRDVRVISGPSWIASSRNTVIYGHNWTNWGVPYRIGNQQNHTIGGVTQAALMFSQLPSYTNIEFARANPYIYYSDEQKEGIWKVFAVATVEISNDFNYNGPNPNDELYQSLLNEWKLRSRFNFEVDVNTNDRILTLSTCTNEHPVSGDRQRLVVVARLLRPNETENDTVNVTVNPNPKRPVF